MDRSEGMDRGEDSVTRFLWQKAGYIFGLAGVVVAIVALFVR